MKGWAGETNARYSVTENGDVTRIQRGNTVQPSATARTFEQLTGETSTQRLAQEVSGTATGNAHVWRGKPASIHNDNAKRQCALCAKVLGSVHPLAKGRLSFVATQCLRRDPDREGVI